MKQTLLDTKMLNDMLSHATDKCPRCGSRYISTMGCSDSKVIDCHCTACGHDWQKRAEP